MYSFCGPIRFPDVASIGLFCVLVLACQGLCLCLPGLGLCGLDGVSHPASDKVSLVLW